MIYSHVNIDEIIANSAKIIAPVWPLQTFIARNPLSGMESFDFEEALLIGEKFFTKNANKTAENFSRVNQEMIKWCQVFLDEGQASITMPEREKGFYRAWSLLAPFDKNLHDHKKNNWLNSLPLKADEAIIFSLKMLKISENEIEEFLQDQIAELPGWSGYIKWRSEWVNTLKNPITLKDFLAVRLLITCALEKDHKTPLSSIKTSYDVPSLGALIEQIKTKEELYLKELLKKITQEAIKIKNTKEQLPEPDVQLVFCIDVRSEPFRMRLEQQGNYETLGFAGFFGLPLTIHEYNTNRVSDCCPVLLKPIYKIYEEPLANNLNKITHRQIGQSLLKGLRRFYQDLKYNFATPFALVETLGVWCGLWMAIRTLMPKNSVKFKKKTKEWISPTLLITPKIDIPFEEQMTYAASALRIMGLTKKFSPLVVLCGHKSTTENNPYASALDCGACGGNHGGPNSKILAAILNNPLIRSCLATKGILIPENTLFIGAEHNTTTDEVLIDKALTTKSHTEILEKLNIDLKKAGIANNQYRCKTFGVDKSQRAAKEHVFKRSSDWAEVRPEWGLARNAALIVGPRSLTKNLNLDGRCFLHSYEWEDDSEGKSLETILTAPMIVAQWINAQYLFSTINNTVYGSGSKITHNITGKIGVMQGNGSDLMHGLPLQSVNSADDKNYHDPMRLQTIVYAPRGRINAIVTKHDLLKNLISNKWIILIAIDPEDNETYRLMPNGKWA